ncbi:arsenite efflux transporter metallochaperone ArsD [Peribacillus sp.]|uniref:arsenite efflux transporter metallochaperone ArsD n=1 Tax=Peribacillus sp. TaxID=2675267 RepID=UPI00388E1B60
MKEIQIFDPAMCCPTGVCGPSIDPELLRMSFVISNLKKKDYPIERYNLTNDTEQFMQHEQVSTLLNEKGPDVLPIVFVDGNVVRTGSYPSNEELGRWTGFSVEELIQKPKVRLSLKTQKDGES